jgi:putative transposase
MMDTHLHLLLSARKAGALARAMLVLLSAHARLQNLALETRGPLWLDRYSSVVIQDESHLVNTCLYVEANPWRAFMVDHPADSQWTSYQANALDSGHRILTAHPVMAALGSDAQSWHQAYRDLMECYLKSACRFKSLTHAARTADPLAALRLCAVDVT